MIFMSDINTHNTYRQFYEWHHPNVMNSMLSAADSKRTNPYSVHRGQGWSFLCRNTNRHQDLKIRVDKQARISLCTNASKIMQFKHRKIGHVYICINPFPRLFCCRVSDVNTRDELALSSLGSDSGLSKVTSRASTVRDATPNNLSNYRCCVEIDAR